MKKNNILKLYEIILIILVWVVLVISPVLFSDKEEFSLVDLIGPLRIMVPLFFIFLINRFILVPNLLLKKKNFIYILTVIGLIAVFTFGLYLFTENRQKRMPRQQTNERWRPPPSFDDRNRKTPPLPERKGRPMPPYANLLIFSFLLVGFDTGLMSTFKLAKSERQRAKLEKENAETQLAFLRNQVSPHFFMNTLNNIHALIDIDSEEAKESIIRLSKLMRHLLYDSEIERIPLQKEIDFIKNYVDLMKLRFSDKVKIDLHIPDQLPEKSIPPLLFTSYVENAFKHGISYQQNSFIEIAFSCSVDNLTFKIRNSNPDNTNSDESSGIGIENSRKRLELLYGNMYILKIEKTKLEHSVFLSIPL